MSEINEIEINNEVTLNVENLNTFISPQLQPEVSSAIEMALSYEIKCSKYSQKFIKGHWDGRIRLYKKKNQSFATGLIRRVIDVLKTYSIQFEVIDRRIKPQITSEYKFDLKLRPYQQTSVDEMIRCGRGIVKVGTGGGKSVIIAGYMAKVNVPTLIIVPRKSLLIQFSENLKKWLDTDIGVIGDSVCNPKRITVATMQSLVMAYSDKITKNPIIDDNREKIKNVLNSVECLVVDEAQHLSSESLQFLEGKASNSYFRFSFSATPFYDLDNTMLVERFTGRTIVDISASDLISMGYLSRPTIKMYPHIHNIPYSVNMNYSELYTLAIVNNNGRNNHICDVAVSKAKENKSMLIAVTRIEHGNILLEKIQKHLGDKVEFVNGSNDSKEMYSALKRLDKKELICVIATTVFGEGVDCPFLDCLILAKGQMSSVDVMQLVGRVLRKTDTKSSVEVIDFWDKKCKWLSRHSKIRYDIYCSEKEFDVRLLTS